MDSHLQDFLLRLGRGPAVLLLGQKHLRMESGTDPLLSQIGEKYSSEPLASYDELLRLDLSGERQATVAWLDERCQRILPSTQLETLAEYPWSSALTSAIDTVWARAFRRPWRDVQPVFEEKHQPADARNRSRLHCFFLFGNVNRADSEAQIPLSPFERLRRAQVATGLARRIPDLVTPLGTLAIEGYGVADWLTPDILAPILADLNPGQVHLFSPGGEELQSDPMISELVTRGVAHIHDTSLPSALVEGASGGLLELGPSDFSSEARSIRLGDRSIRIPEGLWKRTRTSATALDDATLVQPPPLSGDAIYRDFRTFLGAGDSRPDWDAYARGFAFERDFERTLRQATDVALGTPGFQERPLILHGPTGSGKTIALASLARKVRLDHRYPVLHIERRSQQVNFSDLDAFCEWAEQNGATATLVTWDGMLEARDYFEALRYLNSRGRNVVVVGSSYRMQDGPNGNQQFVAAPAHLGEEEALEFREFLASFDSSLGALLEPQRITADEAFLVALYRLLPPVRGVVRAGVTRELRHAERIMASAAALTEASYSGVNTLTQALIEAGLVGGGLSELAEKRVGTELVDDFQHLTGLVMVPGRFGLRVPLELLLRTLGHGGFENFLTLLKGVDIFRWFEDTAGNIEIGARSRLEASLISEARAGGPETEAALVKELVLELKQDGMSSSGGREIDFAVGLLRAVGPGGRHAASFSTYFVYFADALREARLERGLAHPRLSLQESNLRREAAVDASKSGAWAMAAIEASLDAAEDVVREGLMLLPESQGNKGLRSALLVELASTMGARATQLVHGGASGMKEASAVVVSLREVVNRARLENPTSYHPVDVLAWATRNAVERNVLSGVEKLEAITDVLSAFQNTELAELDPKSAEQFHARRYEIGALIGDGDLTEDARTALKKRGSGAALFLEALQLSHLVEAGHKALDVDPEAIATATRVLESEPDLLWSDPRCLDLYLDLWWFRQTGERPLSGERIAPKLATGEWQSFLDIVNGLQEVSTTRRPAVLGFLRGLALFHLGRIPEAFSTFKAVERESMAVRSRRRVIRTYVASTPNGTPRAYHGTVSWLDPNGRKGEIYVEELRRNLVFFAHDFRLDEPHNHMDMGEFHIAFNFLGPIADPA